MSGSLQSRLSDLTASFAESVLEVIRSSSLEDLLSEGGATGARRREQQTPKTAARPTRTSATGRLKRRSAGDIAKSLDQVIALVKKHKDGLRAEQIRSELKMQAKEMPRILKEGLASKKLRSMGQKRATTYFAR